VEVTEVGGDLKFEITLTPRSAGRDLHELYFNLGGGRQDSRSARPTSSPHHTLLTNPPVAGAASSFEFGVNFGNGAGAPGARAGIASSARRPAALARRPDGRLEHLAGHQIFLDPRAELRSCRA
jgi:hypothetical protein